MVGGRVRVKICGITGVEDLYISALAGADFVGFVVGVPSSPRSLPIKEAKELMEVAPSSAMKVVVTVFSSTEKLLEIYDCLRPDFMQVHSLPMEAKGIREVATKMPIIRAVNIHQGLLLEEALRNINSFKMILIDSRTPGKYGGTGVTHDWSVSKRIRDLIYPKPLILAGELNPENVYEAILTVKPFAVDVSSGVESKPGIKDERKIVSFIREVRRAESLLK